MPVSSSASGSGQYPDDARGAGPKEPPRSRLGLDRRRFLGGSASVLAAGAIVPGFLRGAAPAAAA
jgi:hypothetical protein